MKKITALLFLILFPVILFGQILQNAYEVEEKGYLRSPKQTEHGIVATNNYRSEIYLIEDGQKTTLVSSPGAGLYNTLSPDRTQLGFKSINEDGLQAPAVVDLRTGETRLLHDYVTACGQPSFFGESGYAFTIDQTLMVYESTGESAREIDLQEYANIAPVSPDGRYVVYNDMDDVLHLMDLSDQSVEKISATGYASYGPVWSYDSKKIAYMTNGGELFVYSLPEQQNYSMGKGKDPDWFEDSGKLVFTRYETEQFQLKSIHVVESSYDGSVQLDLTDPESTAANDASVTPANEVLYYDLLHREINRIEKRNDQIEIRKKYRLEDQNGALFKPVPDNGSDIQDTDTGQHIFQDIDASIYIDDVPFVNQVWDTPQISGNNYNYAACAPATASMAIGYFERVPPWPSTHYQNITRDYANYVAKEYTAFGHTYNTVSRGVKGGMGFMWHSGHGSSGSPRTTMAKYINQHDLESIQSWSLSYADMVQELRDGNPYPLCVMLTSAGHLILAIGIENDSRRTVIVNDPYGDKNVWYPSYNGINVIYDWPGYNYGNMNLESVPWAVTARGGFFDPEEYFIPAEEGQEGFASLSEAFQYFGTLDGPVGNIQLVISDDLDETSENLILSGFFDFNNQLRIVPAEGVHPTITLDHPLRIPSSYVGIFGAGENEQPGITFHYTGENGGTVIIDSYQENIQLSHLNFTRDAGHDDVFFAISTGLDTGEAGPQNVTLSDNRIGTESVPFRNGLHLGGVPDGKLTISGNEIYARSNAIYFESYALDVEITDNILHTIAAGDSHESGIAFKGGRATVKNNAVTVNATSGGGTASGIRISNVWDDILLANNMITLLPDENDPQNGTSVTGIHVTADYPDGQGDILYYHNSLHIHSFGSQDVSSSMHVTGNNGDGLTMDVRNNLFVNEHEADGSGPDGALGLYLDSNIDWSAGSNNWYVAGGALPGYIDGQQVTDLDELRLLTGDTKAVITPVWFAADESVFNLLLDEPSIGDVSLTGEGLPDVVPYDILGNERHPVFPYMGAHEPEPTLAPTLIGDYHIPKGDHDRGYESLSQGLTDLNTNGAEGDFRFIIHEDLDETGSQLLLDRDDLTSSTSMQIVPGDSEITIRIDHPFMISNTSYVTIDGGGDRDLRFLMQNESAVQAIWIVGGARYVTLRNLDIQHEFGKQAGVVGVQVRRDDAATHAPAAISLEGLHIGSRAYPFKDGIRLWGTGDPILRVRADVTGSEIVASHRGIATFFVENSNYSENTIDITGDYGNQSWYGGVYLAGAQGISVRDNQIRMRGVNTASASYVAGILLNLNQGSHNIINNMISITDDFESMGSNNNNRLYGIAVNREGDGERYNIFHNSICVGEAGQSARSAALGWERYEPEDDPANFFIMNNLFSNRNNRDDAYGYYWNIGAFSSVRSNNVDVASDGLVGWFEGVDFKNMNDWRAASGVDDNSTNVFVHYRTDDDLSLDEDSQGDESLAGQFVPVVRYDIFGNKRSETAPYKGAWESLEHQLTGAGEDQPVADRPDQFRLTQNYPNPFNSTTRIRYDLPRNTDVRLEVFNITGRRVAVLVNEHRPAGTHEVIFDAGNLASGAYIYRIRAGGFVKNRQMMFVK